MTFLRFAMGFMILCRLMSLSVISGPGEEHAGDGVVQVVWDQPRSTVFTGERFPLILRVMHPPSVTLTHIKVSGLPTDDQAMLTPFERIPIAGQRDDYVETGYRSLAVITQPGRRQFALAVDYIAIERRIRGYIQIEHRETAGRVEVPVWTVDVKAWPSNGRPPQFRDAVGQFDMTTVIEVDEPRQPGSVIRLRTVVSGNGNLDGIVAPGFIRPLPDGWREYAVRAVETTASRRQFERMLVPLQAGEFVIPPLVFAWWDPIRETYGSVTNGPFTVHVQPLPYNLPVFLSPEHAGN